VRRPNILLLMADQLAASWLPPYGHDVVQAPHISALAAEGVVFDSAYCPSPLCAPSRAALLTGRLPSRTGVYDNAAELRASEPTVTHQLRAAGYDTCLSGKMHFVGPDQLHGFEQRLTTDIYPADLGWTPDWRVPPAERLPWYHTMESVVSPGVCAASMQMDYDEEVAHRAVRKLRDLARRGREQPFFLCVSFTHPHDPWELRQGYWDRYDEAAIDLPAVGVIPRDEADPHSLRLRDMAGIDDVELTDEQLRTARHAYYAAISYVDERIGEVLGALAESGLRDDTIVLFTADHGELLGERGLWYKMAFFEPAARVPLIVSAPGRCAARRVAEPVSLLDVAPTLLDLCGLEASDDLDGRSLAPALGGTDLGAADVVAEYLAEGVTAPAVMLRRGRFKYVWCEGDPEQLYDLESDPHELVDLAGEQAGLCEQLRAEVARRWDLPALRAAVLRSQADRRLVIAGLHEGRPASWNFVATADREPLLGRDDLYAFQRRARLDAPRSVLDEHDRQQEEAEQDADPRHPRE
jgi:choline-sulfatase